MKTSYSFLPLLVLSGLFGCDTLVKPIDPDRVPSTATRLVVHSYLSPQDTVLAVVVEVPRAVLGQRDVGAAPIYTIPNATVELSDGQRTVRLSFSPADRLYRIAARNLPILAERTYSLTVSAPDYPAVTARCTIPRPAEPSAIQIDTSRESTFGSGTRVSVNARLRWRDPAGQLNFYRTTGLTTNRYTDKVFDRNTGRPLRDTIVTQITPLRFENNRPLSDQGRDGGAFVSARGEITNFRLTTNDPALLFSVTMTLRTLDEANYRYQEALERHDAVGDNPFAEPVLIPSNIQGGLGCFGGYNQASLTLRLR
jgi:Domain of unknown function (DUF4249)